MLFHDDTVTKEHEVNVRALGLVQIAKFEVDETISNTTLDRQSDSRFCDGRRSCYESFLARIAKNQGPMKYDFSLLCHERLQNASNV